MIEGGVTLVLPPHLVALAESSLPEGHDLEDWILTWTQHGLETAARARITRESAELREGLLDVAKASYEEGIAEIASQIGVDEGQLLAPIGETLGQVSDVAADLAKRLEQIEEMTDLGSQTSAFGALMSEMKAMLDRNRADSIPSRLEEMLGTFDEEGSPLRSALEAVVDAKLGPFTDALNRLTERLITDDATTQALLRTTFGGLAFEDAVHAFSDNALQSDHLEITPVGTTVGLIRSCRKGDILLEFLPEHVLAGAKVIIEVKQDTKFNTRTKMLDELDIAMENRDAEVGVFVASALTTPTDMNRLSRHGKRIIVVWDQDNPATDHLLVSALYIGLGLVEGTDEVEEGNREAIRTMVGRLEQEVRRAEKMETHVGTARGAINNIDDELRKQKGKLGVAIREARDTLAAMGLAPADPVDVDISQPDVGASEQDEGDGRGE